MAKQRRMMKNASSRSLTSRMPTLIHKKKKWINDKAMEEEEADHPQQSIKRLSQLSILELKGRLKEALVTVAWKKLSCVIRKQN